MLFFKSYFKANCVNQKSKAAEISHAISECTMTFIGQHNLKSPTFLNTHVQLHSIFASHLFFFFLQQIQSWKSSTTVLRYFNPSSNCQNVSTRPSSPPFLMTDRPPPWTLRPSLGLAGSPRFPAQREEAQRSSISLERTLFPAALRTPFDLICPGCCLSDTANVHTHTRTLGK